MINIPIVFAFSNKYALPGWVSIASLIKTAKAKTRYLIYVIYDDLDQDNIQNILLLVKNYNHDINFIDISTKLKKIDPFIENQNWPKILYARLYITEILPNYQKIIVSDVDVLFKKDLRDIFNKDLSRYHYGLVAAEKRIQNNLGHKRYDFYENKYIYYSGFVIYNTIKMKEDKICEKFDIALSDYKNILKNKMTDLILLNMCSNSIYRIPFNYCVLESLILKKNVKNISEYIWLSQLYSDNELESFRENPSIIHYSGHGEHRDRPWNRLSPPGEYLNYIYVSPYKNQWLAERNLKKIIRSNNLFLHISNSRIYKNYLKKFFEILSLVIIKYFYK